MDNLLVATLIATLGLTAALTFRLLILIRRLQFRETEPLEQTDQLPTVSVCIPARNETHAMTACLERVTASDYSKMEVIVLDDSSVDGTSFLIKAFAHAGVRFVEGSALPDDWLGKAFAQQTLFEEASGEYIFFMDVDTYIKPKTLSRLVNYAIKHNLDMASALPLRNDQLRGSVVFATLHHLWTLLSHRPSRPAATSNAWLVRRQFLEDQFSGLESIRNMVEPERLIARAAAEAGGYQFFVSNQQLGVSYQKKWQSQVDTSVRLLFPRFGGRVLTAFLALISLLVLMMPFILPINLLVDSVGLVYILALTNAVMLVAFYIIYTIHIWREGWLLGGIMFPVILFQEAVLLMFSIIAYATQTVRWKGRPIRVSARTVSRPATTSQK